MSQDCFFAAPGSLGLGHEQRREGGNLVMMAETLFLTILTLATSREEAVPQRY